MENNHPIENLMKTTMENIRNMIHVSTVVGDAMETADGKSIIPISKVSFGFATGGADINNKNISKENYPFGGGSGAGVTVKPVAFLVVNGNSIKLIPVDQVNSSDKIVEAIPQVLEMIKSLGKKNKEEKED